MTLRNNLLFIENIKNKLGEVEIGINFAKAKFQSLLSKSHGYSQLSKIDKIINGEINEYDDIEKLSVEDLTYLKYAPVLSCDVK